MELSILLVLFLAILQSGMAALPCHRLCSCIWRNGKELVHCNDKELATIPAPIDVATQLLHLENNAIRYLTATIFIKRGLYNLQGIFLQENNMEQIDAKAFEGLENLVHLDMSNNKLGIVPSDALSHVSGLRELKLNNNPISRIGQNAFFPLNELFRLELSDCLLKHIDEKAFRGLIKLQWLRLDNNKLKMIPSHSLMPLNSIREVELHSNPWSCDCLIRYLKQWLEQLNPSQQQQPLCASPPRLLGAPIGSVSLNEFSCLPTIRHNVARHNVWTGENVTLVCAVSASPEARVGWLWDNHGILNGSVTVGGTQYLIYTHGSEEKTSLLTVIDAEEAVAGRYTCQARNSAGSAVSHFRVGVSERQAVTHVTFRMDSVVLVVILVGVVVACILLSLCICMIFIKRKRRDAKFASSFDLDQFAATAPSNKLNLMTEAGHSGASVVLHGSESCSADSYGEFVVSRNDHGPNISQLDGSEVELHNHSFEQSLQLEPILSAGPFSRLNSARGIESGTPCGAGTNSERRSNLLKFTDDYNMFDCEDRLRNKSGVTDDSKYFSRENEPTLTNTSYHTGNTEKNSPSPRHLTSNYCDIENLYDTHTETYGTNRLPSKSSSFNFTEMQMSEVRSNGLKNLKNTNLSSRYDSASYSDWTTSINNDFTDSSITRARSKTKPKAGHERNNWYVYHNVQLDKYMQKYETLQEKFDQMKRSCESVSSVTKPTRTLPRIPSRIGSRHSRTGSLARSPLYQSSGIGRMVVDGGSEGKQLEHVIQC